MSDAASCCTDTRQGQSSPAGVREQDRDGRSQRMDD